MNQQEILNKKITTLKFIIKYLNLKEKESYLTTQLTTKEILLCLEEEKSEFFKSIVKKDTDFIIKEYFPEIANELLKIDKKLIKIKNYNNIKEIYNNFPASLEYDFHNHEFIRYYQMITVNKMINNNNINNSQKDPTEIEMIINIHPIISIVNSIHIIKKINEKLIITKKDKYILKYCKSALNILFDSIKHFYNIEKKQTIENDFDISSLTGKEEINTLFEIYDFENIEIKNEISNFVDYYKKIDASKLIRLCGLELFEIENLTKEINNV